MEKQVAAVAPMLEEAIEVPAAEPMKLVVGHGRVVTMLVAAQREVGDGDRAPTACPRPEAEVEVRVAVEAEAVVEQTLVAQDLATDGKAVGLDRVDLARRGLLEV